ncbi:MAG: alpha/beta fold hydrolase [Spirochaetaceae bacterium]|jgi:alpha-beta hydrolase superfamily lysophospholipase|nr:alpha/beta fold hydrolase [Spirochaetaceae bacterium]
MNGSRYTFKSEDYRDISAVKWIPDEGIEVIGAVQICHGLAEHIARYEDFALFLNNNGFVVIGNDHRGHGKSLETVGDTGIFAEKDGWDKALNDIRKVTMQLKDQHRDLPLFMISHSMGSFFARNYIAKWGSDLAGVILSGTGNQKLFMVKLLKFLAKVEILIRGKRHRSSFFDKLSFGSFNKPFEPGAPTPFEWLSRDRDQVDKYVADPLCGFICTSSHFYDFAEGLIRVCSDHIYKLVPKYLPVFLYSGDHDPVGENSLLVKEVYNNYKKAGLVDVSMELNIGGRHESLNEINKEEVYRIFLQWLKNHIPD